jgi:PAS domain S-box-containing protein
MKAHRILVVEDEVIVARDIGQHLTRLGYEVVGQCRSGEEAIQEADRHRPEVVLMDIHLAGELDGIEAARTIRKQTGAAIVFLTAFSGPETIERAKHIEPFGYVIKPFNPHYLHAVIEMALYKHHAETQLRRAYDERGTLLRTTIEAFFLADGQGRLLDVNDSACAMLGYSREELLKLSFSDLDASNEAFPFLGIDPTQLPAPRRLERFQRRKDGTVLCVEMSINSLSHSGGRIFCFANDVTERKASEAALFSLNEDLETRIAARTADLHRARQNAEAAAREKASFLAAMGRELRAPLDGAVGILDLLKQTPLDLEQTEMLGLAIEAVQSVSSLTEDLLDFTKLETGDMKIQPAPASIEHVIQKSCSLLGLVAQKAGVELTQYADPRIPARVLGDEARIRQILMPLVRNAIRFSKPEAEHRRVSVRARLVDINDDNATVEIEVKDNGIGMSDEVMDRLFEPVKPGADSQSYRGSRMGVGLAVARNLAALMGGDIRVNSALGTGSTVTTRLTLALAPDAANAAPMAPEVAGLSCLVVGTDTLAHDLADYLDSAGAAVDLVPDVSTARQRMAGPSHGPWVWILDLHGEAPEPETLRRIAHEESEQDTRFILVGRGRRRTPRFVAPGVMVMDANELSRSGFLAAVASAAAPFELATATRPIALKRSSIAPPAREDARAARRLVLVADDDEVSRQLTVRQLQLLGYAAEGARNGSEALDLWSTGDYGLLLTDARLSGVDGFSLAAAVRMQDCTRQHALIVGLTSEIPADDVRRCREEGIDDYLRKPARLSDLKGVIEKWLPTRQSVHAMPASKEVVFGALSLN